MFVYGPLAWQLNSSRLTASLVAMGRVTSQEAELIMAHFTVLDLDHDGLLRLTELGDISDHENSSP